MTKAEAAQPSIEAVRVFPAPRHLVFTAWSTAEHVKRWFSPASYTTPEAEVDFRPGGVFAVCMRAPNGQEFWSRGHFVEVSPPDRLVFVFGVGDPAAPLFTARTTVTFEDDGKGGTRMSVRQVYDIHDPAALGMVAGASDGWRTTLDNLEAEVARLATVG